MLSLLTKQKSTLTFKNANTITPFFFNATLKKKSIPLHSPHLLHMNYSAVITKCFLALIE